MGTAAWKAHLRMKRVKLGKSLEPRHIGSFLNQRLKPVILATWEAEIRKIEV
jgi:hypothetical protein